MKQTTWLDTKLAAAQLGVNAERLRRLHRGGWFKFGTHIRSKSSPDALKPHLQFNVEKVSELLETERHKWKNYAPKEA